MAKSTREQRRLRLIHDHLDEHVDRRHGVVPAPSRKGKKKSVWLLLTLCLIGSAVVSFFIFRALVATTPPELVGTWQVMQGPLKGATMEFRTNGTAVLSKGMPGDQDDFLVKVDNNKIFLSGKDARTGKQDTFVQTIVSLSEEELVIRDEDRITYRMVRVRK